VGLISLSSVRSHSTPCAHDWGTLRYQDNASECERQNWLFHPLFCIVGNSVAASTAHLRFMTLYILFRQFSFSLSFGAMIGLLPLFPPVLFCSPSAFYHLFSPSCHSLHCLNLSHLLSILFYCLSDTTASLKIDDRPNSVTA